ncbi:hypothetical protein PENANT_c012G03916 [Penicillium antarcticum]|uniref:Cytochrome P450 n=1 Tax=Penicillium antarcticum TaxID=416450 RepID=A0A1V6Q5V1_9EURO|nr:hypothetical protein PENANT_c012G03916 [Penicillium antarcticum]
MSLSLGILVLLSSISITQAAVCLKYLPQYFENQTLHHLFWCAQGVNIILWAIYETQIYPRFICPLRQLPGPTGGYPLLGYGLIRFKKPVGPEYLKFMQETSHNGLMRYRGFLNTNNVLLASPQTLAEVLVKRPYDFEKPEGPRNFMRRVLGDGLVLVEGDVHKFQRKRLMPSFSFRNIKDLYPTFWDKSIKLTDAIAEKVLASSGGTGITDVNFWSTKVTLDIIGIAGLGRDFNTIKNSDDLLAQTYDKIMEPSLGKMIIFALTSYKLHWLNQFVPGRIDAKLESATDSLRRTCIHFVHEKREKSAAMGSESTDILSKLMETNEFSNEELVDQLLTFIAAGHETTSSTFAWVIYLLASNPHIQSQLREEIHANLRTTSPVDADSDLSSVLESLPLLNGVCNETLRLYPTVPLSMRTPRQDTTIAGQRIPKGTEIYIVPWAVNRDQELWGPDADVFKPERWIDAETGKPNNTGGTSSNYSILTFLHGVHSCIGQGFAKAELRALTAAFVGAFEIELAYPDRPPIPAGLITTKPEGGIE